MVNNMPMVDIDDGSVTISWAHNIHRSGVPVTSFRLRGGVVGSEEVTISEDVEGMVFSLTIPASQLLPETNYRVTITAVNLLGDSEPRDVTFTSGKWLCG